MRPFAFRFSREGRLGSDSWCRLTANSRLQTIPTYSLFPLMAFSRLQTIPTYSLFPLTAFSRLQTIPTYSTFPLTAFSHLNASRRNSRQLEHCNVRQMRLCGVLQRTTGYYTEYCAQYSRPNRQQLEQRDARQRVQLSERRPAHLQKHPLSLPMSTVSTPWSTPRH
jgi:hypothetical protein